MPGGLDLLPVTASGFKAATYWKEFFLKQNATDAFEWYGEYSEFGSVIDKYLKPSDKILQVGCGNSQLADQLYDSGFHNVTSIDIVNEVIKRQTAKNLHRRPSLVFDTMDATALTFADASFNVVLDKGTIDALLPENEDDPSSGDTVRKVFTEVWRVLTLGGRYIIISLAQAHVVSTWMRYFSDKACIVRIHQVSLLPSVLKPGGFPLPSFLLIVTKLKPMLNSGTSTWKPILEFINYQGQSVKSSTTQGLMDLIVGAQQHSVVCYRLQTEPIKRDEEIEVTLCAAEQSQPKYTITLLDDATNNRGQYAVFVVPQGRETEWMFSVPKGRRTLLAETGYRRLAVVCLGREFLFSKLNDVMQELNTTVMNYAPTFCLRKGAEVPFLSLGDDLGERKVIHNGCSELSGSFVVEDVRYKHSHNGWMRRLVFLTSQNVVQSEAKLKRSTKDELTVDFGYLACKHHYSMLGALGFLNVPESEWKICIVGLGGGALAAFVSQTWPKANVTAVELDASIVNVARNWFQFDRVEKAGKVTVIVDDGIMYLHNCANKSVTYDAIFLDVAGSTHDDGLYGPPSNFLHADFLQAIIAVLGEAGVLVVNLITRDKEKTVCVLATLKNIFSSVLVHDVKDEVNSIVICSMRRLSKECVAEARTSYRNIVHGSNEETLTLFNDLVLCD